MSIKTNDEKCDGCMKCADICPQQALIQTEVDGKKVVTVKADDCIDCYLCIPECPNQALTE